MGIDIDPKALSLARQNLDHNLQVGLLTRRASTDVQFHRADVLGSSRGEGGSEGLPNVEKVLSEYFPLDPGLESGSTPGCDLLISNPPYISTKDFRNGTTARSVRLFEPRLALVPPPQPQSFTSTAVQPEDIFYNQILKLSHNLRTKLTVLECGDIKQAERVIELHKSMALSSTQVRFDVQIWPDTKEDMDFYGFHYGQGSRCVIIRRNC